LLETNTVSYGKHKNTLIGGVLSQSYKIYSGGAV